MCKTLSFVKGWMGPTKSKPLSPQMANKGMTPRKELPQMAKKAVINKKDKLLLALGAARALKRRGLRNPSIEKSFAAASSVDSKNAKKRTVAKILETLRGNDSPLPLTQEVLKGLDSALQEGGYKAGEGYIIEAKLWHIEDAQGNKAGEPDIERLDDGSPQQESHSTPPHQQDGPGGSRCEAHLAVPVPQQLVRAGMPVQSHLRPSYGLVDKVEKFNGSNTPVAMMKDKKPATKAQIVKTWRWLYGQGVSGHSGRRSGALSYIRAGWSIT